jgi:hypothetical protein
MTHNRHRNDILERIADELADSVFSRSDDAFLVEAGTVTQEEAERTRMVLSEALRKLESVDRHLSTLGHKIDPDKWQREWFGYSNTCSTCGSHANFDRRTGEMRGDALHARCRERDQYTIRRRQVSGG